MPEISIAVDADRVRALLQRAPNDLNAAMRGATEDATTYLLALIRRYPQQRAGSTYRRTGTLNRSWSRRVEGTGLSIRGFVGSNGNIAPYNRYVQSRREQAAVHRGRWQTVEDVAEHERDRVVQFYRDRLRAAGY